MSAESLLGFVNLGAAGAVIAVVILFLNYLKKRDESWQEYIKNLRIDDQTIQKKMDDSYVERNTLLVTSLNLLTGRIQAMQEFDTSHHAAMAKAITEMRKNISTRERNERVND